ncbi:MAG: ABC transporter permease [Nitrospiraceae bacterium]|nr:MAG: ABC transporter permease [Nitrospiraceae bacterium]
MITLKYFLGTAFKSIWLEKWINLLTILSISIGLSILCLFLLITFNVESFMKQWTSSFGLVVYLDDHITYEETLHLEAQFKQDKDVLSVSYTSNVEALDEIKASLGANAVIMDDFKENPLPSIFELELASELLDKNEARQKADSIKQLPGVNDVQYGEKWLASLNTISDTMRLVAVFFASAIFISTIFTTYNTIKIFFYRRKEELKTLKLLGATNSFARLPFLIEGLFVGVVGGSVSSALVFAFSSLATTRIVEFMPSLSVVLSPLPVQVYLIIPAVGASMSLLGSLFAVGKIRY